ncbi:MAG TPA: hypothetical protein VHO94_04270 [Oscillospiraceae bacterium]|nr:hypothetical protein [Oscillospiraceae bacterium]
MRYIKDFFALGVISGLSGLVAGAGTTDFIVLGISTVAVVTCSIGVCIAERVEEELKNVEPMRKMPKQKP